MKSRNAREILSRKPTFLRKEKINKMQETMRIYHSRCKYLIENGCPLTELNEYRNFKDCFSKYEFEKILTIQQNRRNKRYRTKEKFKEMYRLYDLVKSDNKNVVFGTLTLDDETLSKAEDTYIRKIHKWMKKHFIFAILNKDFGKKTEREHYHFIGLTIEDLEDTGKVSKKGYEIYELVDKDYKLGFEPDLCIIDFDKGDIDHTINYLLKLNNHSTKITTRNRVRIVKNKTYSINSLVVGFEATNGEKAIKKRKFENF